MILDKKIHLHMVLLNSLTFSWQKFSAKFQKTWFSPLSLAIYQFWGDDILTWHFFKKGTSISKTLKIITLSHNGDYPWYQIVTDWAWYNFGANHARFILVFDWFIVFVLGGFLKVCMQIKGEGDLTKSIYLLFYWRHSFC